MKKIVNAGLLICSLFVYPRMGWQLSYLYFSGRMGDVLQGDNGSHVSLHPFVLLPLAGQMMLFVYPVSKGSQ